MGNERVELSTRMSTDQNDPGYPYFNAAKACGRSVNVYLDGLELKYVITADAAEGWVEFGKTDKDGNFVLDGDEFVIERRYGRVEIRLT